MSYIRHGLSKTRLYKIYTGMIQRCYNKKNPKYSFYGERGIDICNEWLNKENGFINFYTWSINNGYNDTLCIDRINNEKGYYPNNCRWVSMKEQCNNRRERYYDLKLKKYVIGYPPRILKEKEFYKNEKV